MPWRNVLATAAEGAALAACGHLGETGAGNIGGDSAITTRVKALFAEDEVVSAANIIRLKQPS